MPVIETSMVSIDDSTYISDTTRTTPLSFLPPSCSNATAIGAFCNISNSPCDLLQPCSNDGTCHETNVTKRGYVCRCLPDFNGTECQLNHRPCRSDTCWNDGEIVSSQNLSTEGVCLGTCHTTVTQSILCLCTNGWEGGPCQSQANLCQNVQCLNDGVCRPIFLNYTCECLGQSYSGRHCEITSQETIGRQRLSKSFAYIAIVAMVGVAVLVITMDVFRPVTVPV